MFRGCEFGLLRDNWIEENKSDFTSNFVPEYYQSTGDILQLYEQDADIYARLKHPKIFFFFVM